MTNVWILTIIISQLYLRVAFAELKLVQTIFRHGNRWPTKESYYPNDPYFNYSYGPDGVGGLTNVGRMSSYKLGQFFRERYGQFLGELYTKENIYFRADEVDRVVMTGELVAAGLYPPVGQQRWHPSLNWQPIPVWVTPMDHDYLYNGMFCENYRIWRNNVDQTDKDVIKFQEEHREFYKYLSEHTGFTIPQDRTLGLRQLLFAQLDVGLELPEWTKPIFPNGMLNDLALYDIFIRNRTLKLKQLLGGVWIKEWLTHVDNYLNKSDSRKAFMYAAHDLNIASILVALDQFDHKIPSYSSSLLFELHEEDNKYYVKILYRNDGEIRAFKFPGCKGYMCPLEVFKKLVAHLIPQDIKALCWKSGKGPSN